jgi:outer membrane receptor protein involved in Fe transport
MQTSRVSGNISDQSGQPVPYANVALLSEIDSSLVDGAVSDINGAFLIQTPKTGTVQVVVSSIGFTSFESAFFQLKGGTVKHFGKIEIVDESTGLDEVTVRSSRPELIIEADKTTINVEGTVMAEGANALDVIGRSPGIYVDQDGNINLNGRTGVNVMINDRLTYMSATDLASFLRAMPADNIKSIEVINNPTARFDAEGSAGVINIILKKNKVDGIFGNVQAGMLYNGQMFPNTGIALNVKQAKWSSNANLNYNENGRFNDLEINRNFALPEGVSNFYQDSRIKSRYKNLFFNGATNYQISDSQNLGLNIQASDSKDTDDSNSLTDIITPGVSDITYLQSNNASLSDGNRVFANLHYDNSLDTIGTKLSADVDFTRMNSGSNSLLNNLKWIDENTSDVNRYKILTLNDMYYNIFTAKVDVVKLVGNGNTIETGVKGSWVKSDNKLDLSKSYEEGPFISDSSSNRFIYHENVLAAYLSYKGKFSKKFSYQIGLRGEHSTISGNSVTLKQVNNQKYFNLFPSLFVQQKVNENYQIIYTANQRITRPNYRLLNPFIYYIDPYTTETGNPNLKPEYSTNFEMKHVFKETYQLTLGYSETEDAFMQVFVQNEESRTTTTFTDNFDKTKNANFSAIIPVDIKEWWSTSNMLQVNYNQYKSQIGNDLLNVSNTSFMIRSQHNLTLPLGFKAEIMGIYLGPQIWGQGEIAGFGWVDAGVSKSIMKDKITLSVNGTDIFRTQVIKAKVDFADIDTNFKQYRSNQGIRFTVKYKFSKGDSFKVKSNSGSSEEQNRLD